MEKERRILVIGATNTDIAGECFFPMVLEDSNIWLCLHQSWRGGP